MLRENVEAELTPKYIFVIIFVYKHKKAGNQMASSIVHLAITNELIKTHEFNNISRLKLGVVLPDAGETNLGHLKIKIPETNGSTYDFEKFRCKFRNLLKTDDLYLGYYLHLVQDICYRHFVYDRYHWNPTIPGNVDRLHRDYAITNHYVAVKYGLKNDIVIPDDFDREPINEICRFDIKWLTEALDTYFHQTDEGDIFFFTKEMTDEYISEAIALCNKELLALKTGTGMIDGYENAWHHL